MINVFSQVILANADQFCFQVVDAVQTSSRDIYQHFDKPVDGRATCKHCQRSISCYGQSSSNLHKHLAVHKIVLEKMRRVRKNAEQPTLQVTKTRRSTTMTKTEQESCDFLLVCLLCRDYLPFQIVESPRFKAFVFSLNPRYRLPTRAAVSSEMVPALASRIERSRRIEHKNWGVCSEHSGCVSHL